MHTLESRQSVKADPDVAWQRVSDPHRFAAAATGLARVEMLEGAGKGARWRFEDQSGHRFDALCTKWEPGRGYHLELEASPDGPPYKFLELAVAVAPAADGLVDVVVQCRYQPRLSVVGEVLDAAWGRAKLQAQVDTLLENWAVDIRQQAYAHRITVQSILNEKGSEVYSVLPDQSIGEVARFQNEKRVGAVLVIDRSDKLCGIVSERDIVRALAEQGPAALEQPVATIMSANLVVCTPEHDMEFVMACMTDRRIRHLPVLRDNQLAGIISIGDVVRQRIMMLESQSQNMRDYIEAREWRFLNAEPADLQREP